MSTADKKDLKNNLDHFIVHNLYENIFSSNGKQDQLLYIIALLIKEEINNLETEEDNELNIQKFLNETACGFIVEELLQKKGVQSFFKNIINIIIKKIEKECSVNPITFEIGEIIEKIVKHEIIDENLYLNMRNQKKERKIESYIVPLNKKQLEDELEKSKDPEIKNHLIKKIQKCETNQNLYSCEKLIDLMYQLQDSDKIYSYYQNSFEKIINLINLLLDNLLLNSKTIPYYIKCICKIISVFIQKKFPKFNKIEKNAYAAKFFFGKLLFLIFKNPALYSLINERLISGKTIDILRIIQFILTKFIEGNFFNEDTDYAPFNAYFIQKMPTLLKFFENLNQVVLPSFIDKFINDLLPEDYIYNYFQENPKEIIFYRQICFNIDILYSLIINTDKCRDKIIYDKITLDKLMRNIKQLEDIKNNKNINENDKGNDLNSNKKNIYYFLISDTINNKKYENILK